MHEKIRFKCPRCGNGVFNPEPTGWLCVICGYFKFKVDCTLLTLWTQVKANMQFAQLDEWNGKDFPFMRSWAFISEVGPPDLEAFRRYIDV